MIMGKVLPIPVNTRGFDCNRPVTALEADAFFALGYRFAVRYVPRIQAKSHDLSKDEIDHLLAGGLAVMPVQHVESESSWTPSLTKGDQYGRVAAAYSHTIGVLEKTCVWLDLEGVSTDFLPSPAERQAATIAYCNAWYDRVLEGGFTPGIYVGWHAGLSAEQLFRRLKFQHYWGAFNLNRDQEPITRGIQMKQGVPKPADIPPGVKIAIDTNRVVGDKLGGLPLAFAPDEWAV